MGNYCSSGQNKKDKDNLSQNSEDSPTYQLASKNKNKIDKIGLKEAPLVDPEPTSDISNFNSAFVGGNGNITKQDINSTDLKPSLKAIHNIRSSGAYDSASSSPLAVNAPCELSIQSLSNQQTLPNTLIPIYGKPSQNRRTENDRKIVIYILAADDSHKDEKLILNHLYDDLQKYCTYRGFELQLCDVHEDNQNYLDPCCWKTEPLEARYGHHIAVQCLSEISRHSNFSYIVPVLFFGNTLGSPLLPLTIESQDFISALSSIATGSDERILIERWYVLDEKSEPPCYRLHTTNTDDCNEVQQLYQALVDIFSKELRDSYLTTVIEQEINNTVLFSAELSKRCIWIHTGVLPNRNADTGGISSVQCEINRRIGNIQNELKNQLCEKNLIRIPPSVQMSNEQLSISLKNLLITNIDSICDDHANKLQIPYCTFGVDRNLLAEIEAVNRHSNLLSQNCANFEIMDKIKQYVMSPSSEPLIIFGPSGCGKSALSAKVSQMVHSWLPDCCFVLRYAGLTQLSSEVTSLVGSIAEQVYYFTKLEAYAAAHTIENYSNIIAKCIEDSKYQLIILIDSLNETQRLIDLDWLPTKLPERIKIIITTGSNVEKINACTPDDFILWNLKRNLSNDSFVHLDQFSERQWSEVLSYGGGDFYLIKLPDSWKNCSEKIPLKAKLFWWLAWLGKTDITDFSLSSICDKVFNVLEEKFGKNVISYLISLIIASRDGLTETEIIKLLIQSKLINGSVQKMWLKFCWLMSHGPMLRQNNHIKLMDNKLKCVAIERYASNIKIAHKLLHDFYYQQPNKYAPTATATTTTNDNIKYCSINHNKFIELPYHASIIETELSTKFTDTIYLSELNWIQTKLSITKCVQFILNDIYLVDDNIRKTSYHLNILIEFLEINKQPINYDAQQFYPLLKYYIRKKLSNNNNEFEQNQIIKEWLIAFDTIPISYLDIIDNNNISDEPFNDKLKSIGYDFITNLSGNDYFVASLNTEREEICVWDVPKCKKVRTLKGIPQPTSLCPVGDHMAAVLCRREIKIIDLNKGIIKITLKGVMNQNMPYYAYCNDALHLVCLSRNRMYVNLMNLESGDCITTFKAGEDRFLNSLLVSGDGRILVCGDETQKPFPLLVWHLSQRKLLYDLRIPHHDFLTSLSAITHEGSYVCVVAKEVNEPAPNFIVVYDLQSGTLFKKWKPSCNTISLSISQANACVIAGLEDARILIWDLVTGNCKFVLVGHSAPVTLLKLDPSGSILLSADKEGRDRSVRLWELSTGKAIAVHTPPKKITTCEILPNGKYIILGIENEPNLVTLELKNCPSIEKCELIIDENTPIYGDDEFNGKIFQL